MIRRPPRSAPFPYTTLFRSLSRARKENVVQVESFLESSTDRSPEKIALVSSGRRFTYAELEASANRLAWSLIASGFALASKDRKSTRLNSTHQIISYPVFFFNDTATTEICALSLHDALPIFEPRQEGERGAGRVILGVEYR